MESNKEHEESVDSVLQTPEEKKLTSTHLPFQTESSLESPNTSSNKRKLSSPSQTSCKSPKKQKIAQKEDSLKFSDVDDIDMNKVCINTEVTGLQRPTTSTSTTTTTTDEPLKVDSIDEENYNTDFTFVNVIHDVCDEHETTNVQQATTSTTATADVDYPIDIKRDTLAIYATINDFSTSSVSDGLLFLGPNKLRFLKDLKCLSQEEQLKRKNSNFSSSSVSDGLLGPQKLRFLQKLKSLSQKEQLKRKNSDEKSKTDTAITDVEIKQEVDCDDCVSKNTQEASSAASLSHSPLTPTFAKSPSSSPQMTEEFLFTEEDIKTEVKVENVSYENIFEPNIEEGGGNN